mmetsp:Transcript_20199/g.56361  ORF Transcript_20199/g.56361 Transcript_20199/m.56361 type:complete len:245 (-) Transcript_20199:833-1567(-)
MGRRHPGAKCPRQCSSNSMHARSAAATDLLKRQAAQTSAVAASARHPTPPAGATATAAAVSELWKQGSCTASAAGKGRHRTAWCPTACCLCRLWHAPSRTGICPAACPVRCGRTLAWTPSANPSLGPSYLCLPSMTRPVAAATAADCSACCAAEAACRSCLGLRCALGSAWCPSQAGAKAETCLGSRCAVAGAGSRMAGCPSAAARRPLPRAGGARPAGPTWAESATAAESATWAESACRCRRC